MSSVLLVEDRGSVRILTMNRPEKRNALNSDLTSGLLEALHEADKSEAVGAVVLTGAGQGFCAGADLSEFKGLQDPKAADKRAELEGRGLTVSDEQTILYDDIVVATERIGCRK